MKTYIKKCLFYVMIAVAITSSKIITFEYVCDYPERGPKFYGFPFIQETDSTWVNSMSGDLYILGFLGNFLFWFAIISSVFFMLSKIKQVLTKVIINIIMYLLFALTVFLSFLNLTMIDWNLKWAHNNFKLEYHQSEINCERNFTIWNP